MYIPIMKNRSEELKATKTCAHLFSKDIVPMFEIIHDDFIPRYLKDEITDEFVYEVKPGKKRRSKIRLEDQSEDIITLQRINECVEGQVAFIDFFRFFENEYGNKKFKNIELSFKMSRDFSYYRSRVLEILEFDNFIPVISIKSGLEISHYDLLALINSLKIDDKPIALRITDDCIEEYEEFIEEHLHSNDYIMLDIREKNFVSKTIEVTEFRDMNFVGTKILLNSPRKRKTKNSEFENLSFTSIIDNSVSTQFKNYSLHGFGDFGGLKDDLPTEGGNGTGAALCLLYFKENNEFFCIVNKDTSLGAKGYVYVKMEVNKRRSFIDPNKNCLGMKKIDSFPKGSFKDWNNANLVRYIHQQSQESTL